MNGNVVNKASVHKHIVADNYNRRTEHTQPVQGKEQELSQERETPQEVETPQGTSQPNTQVQKATKRKKSAKRKAEAKRKKLAKRKKKAKRKTSPLFIATCTLVATVVGVGATIISINVAMNMSIQSAIREGDAALQAQIVALQTRIEGVRTEIQRVDSRVDDIYWYLIENNPPTQ